MISQADNDNKGGLVVKKALDALPFDGDKTKLGVIGTGYGLGAAAFGFPLPTDPYTFIATSLITFALGQLHKWLKTKYPELSWPED